MESLEQWLKNRDYLISADPNTQRRVRKNVFVLKMLREKRHEMILNLADDNRRDFADKMRDVEGNLQHGIEVLAEFQAQIHELEIDESRAQFTFGGEDVP